MIRTGEWLSEAWEIFKQDQLMHIVVGLIVSVASGATGGFILIGPLMCGYYYIILRKLREPGQPIELGDIAKGFEVFVPSLIASLLLGIFVSIGALACFVGTIVVYALLIFAYRLIMDKSLEFCPAIETSFNKTKDNWLGFSLFALALLGVYLLGIIACGVGIYVTGPICVIATALAYRDNFPTQALNAVEPLSMPEPPSV